MTFDQPQAPLGPMFKRGRGEPLTEEEQVQWQQYEKDFARWEEVNHSLGIVDLAEIMERGTKPPQMLVDGLLVQGVHHIVFGTKENGKTWLVMAAAAMVMLGGGGVFWIDQEMGRELIAERFTALGVPPDVVLDHMVYSEFALFDTSPAHRALWAGLLEHHRPALVVVDAHTEVLAAANLNENSGTDIAKWQMAYMSPALALGSATLMIDHTGHENADRSRGSGHKGAQSKVELAVKLRAEFDRETIGRMDVERAKNTAAADIPEVQTFELGGKDRRFIFRHAVEAATPDPRNERAHLLRLKVMRLLADNGTLNQTQVCSIVGGKKTLAVNALNRLVEDETAVAEPSGRSVEYSLTPAGELVLSMYSQPGNGVPGSVPQGGYYVAPLGEGTVPVFTRLFPLFPLFPQGDLIGEQLGGTVPLVSGRGEQYPRGAGPCSRKVSLE